MSVLLHINELEVETSASVGQLGKILSEQSALPAMQLQVSFLLYQKDSLFLPFLQQQGLLTLLHEA